jgi:hypothetical protein
MNCKKIGATLVVAMAWAQGAMATLPMPTILSGVGGNNTSVTIGSANAAKSAFQAAIGGADNGSGTGTHASGFRTINWDGVPDALATPHLLPANYFNTTSPRGVLLLTPGTGVEVSASTLSTLALNFGNINSTYTANFPAFSPERVFAPIDSNILQVYFFQPGTNLPAMVHAFGAVFKDVELSNTTSIRFFAFDGSDLGKYFAPFGGGGQAVFFGALFAPTDPPIGHVVINLGTAALGQFVDEDLPASLELVVMDDMVYAEPQADEIFGDGFD